jgi:hypothetical protein
MSRSSSKSFATLVALGLGVTAVLTLPGILSRKPVATAVAEPESPTAEPPAPKTMSQLLAERIAPLSDLPSGVALARSYFADAFDVADPAGIEFAYWAAPVMTWAALQGVQETKRALVMKDSVVERGYRVCTSGSVVQVRVDRRGDSAIATGILQNGAGEPTHFLAVGSTGDLVERSPARFCGVVVGRYSYSNSGGGTSHAITLVGMFDLPENKRKP